MKLYRALLAAGFAAALSSGAEAKKFGWCEVKQRADYTYYLSTIVEVGDTDADYRDFRDGAFGTGFWEYVRGSFDGDARKPECTIRSTLSEAQSFFEKVISANPNFRYQRTGWNGGRPAPVEANPDQAPSGSYLTVKKTPAAPNSRPAATASAELKKEKAPSGPTAAELASEKHRAVEERNRAAQAKYEAELAEQKRKVEEYERAKQEVARKKAEQQAAAQAAQDAFKAEQAAYAAQLLRHQQEVADQQATAIAQSGAASAPSGQGGRFQATSQIVDTREAAMTGLMNQGKLLPSPITNIQCAEVTMYTPPKWTCWGYYYQDRKPAAGSAQ